VKLKDIFLGILIVALIASEVLLFTANQQKREAVSKLSQAQFDAKQAREDLETAKTAAEAAQGTLRNDNQTLTQKYLQSQNENKRLQAENDRLKQQLGTARQAVQLQQEHLQQLTETPATTAAAPNADAVRDTCVANLRAIQTAKAAWALEGGKTAADVPTDQDLLVYFPGGAFPTCPGGGAYTIGAVGTAPTCSVAGHVLPQP